MLHNIIDKKLIECYVKLILFFTNMLLLYTYVINLTPLYYIKIFMGTLNSNYLKKWKLAVFLVYILVYLLAYPRFIVDCKMLKMSKLSVIRLKRNLFWFAVWALRASTDLLIHGNRFIFAVWTGKKAGCWKRLRRYGWVVRSSRCVMK